MLRSVPFAWTNRGPEHFLRPVLRHLRLSVPSACAGPLTTVRVPTPVTPIPKCASKVVMLLLPVPSVPLLLVVRQVLLIKWLPNARASPDKMVMLRLVNFALTNREPKHFLVHVLLAYLSVPSVCVGPLTTVKVLSLVTPVGRSAPKAPMLLLLVPLVLQSLSVRQVLLIKWLPNARASPMVMLRSVPFAWTNRGPEHFLRPVLRHLRLSVPSACAGPLTTVRVPTPVTPIPKCASKVVMLLLPVPSVPLSLSVR